MAEFAGGEGVEGAEAGGEFGGGQAAHALGIRNQKLESRGVPYPLVVRGKNTAGEGWNLPWF